MSRSVVVLVVVLAVVIGGMFLLAGRAHDVPQARVEKAVDLANLAS